MEKTETVYNTKYDVASEFLKQMFEAQGIKIEFVDCVTVKKED